MTDTNTYLSAVGKQLQSFMGDALTFRITPGEPSQSGLYYRMSQRGPLSQMPPIATEVADATGLAAVAAFISGLSPPPR